MIKVHLSKIYMTECEAMWSKVFSICKNTLLFSILLFAEVPYFLSYMLDACIYFTLLNSILQHDTLSYVNFVGILS